MIHQTRSTHPMERLVAWSLLCIFALHLPGSPAYAGPTGESVVHGEATFSRDGNETHIETGTDQTIVEYDSFDILADEIVRIDQPNETSRILNKIPFGGETHIDGSLLSNGIVYILNPAGVFAGDTAIIDVNSLVAAAGSMSNDDFLAGSDVFTLSGDVLISDGAQIQADNSVALLGRRVANFGTVLAEGGYVAFVAGDRAVLGKLDGRLLIRVDGGNPDLDEFAVTQAGYVEGPRVSLAAGDTYSLAMNHTGVTHGRDLELRAGAEGLVQVAGVLDARAFAEGQTGGRVHVLGEKIAILDAMIDASGTAGGGEIRIGGDVRGEGELPTARRLYVAPDAILRADAIHTGDGGSIVAWSEEKTGFYGTASATGGSESGNGGFIEISGRQSLEARGHTVNLAAANGKSGSLLYDPDRIVITGGGPTDGSDVNDLDNPNAPETQLEGSDGVLGRILNGDLGEAGNNDDAFVIYESEIEGTDADIELLATTHIGVAGQFVGSDVVIKKGNDLTIRTTGQADETDEYQIDIQSADGIEGNGQDLRWVVSEGGTIRIETNSGATDGSGIDGNIRVGDLEFQGRGFAEQSPGIEAPLITARNPIAIVATQGNIVVGNLTANGGNSGDVTDDDTGETFYRFAEAGGNISVGTLSGDVTVNGEIESIGGSATVDSPSIGGQGGVVIVSSENGNATIHDVDVSGGGGLAGIVESGDGDIFLPGFGGRGGAILLQGITEDAERGRAIVEGDLIGRGGDGDGFLANEVFNFTLANGTETGPLAPTNGGQGGQVSIRGDEVMISDSTIDVSAGDGSVEGGDAVTASPGLTDGIILSRIGVDPFSSAVIVVAEEGDIELSVVDILANGGNSGVQTNFTGPGPDGDLGPGGMGGTGGDVQMQALSGSILSDGTGADSAATYTITANGGVGASNGSGPDAQIGDGGSGRNIGLRASDSVNVGNITARGGDGDNGSGGNGGLVTISGGESVILQMEIPVIGLANIDTSGGDAGAGPEPDPDSDPVIFDGGNGGTISVRMNGDEGITGAEVILRGGIGGLGGIGTEEDSDGAGASVDIVATGGSILSDDAAAGIASPNAALTAAVVGDAVDPIRISGTQGETDRATINADGDAFVEVVAEAVGIDVGDATIMGALETLRLNQTALLEDGSMARFIDAGGADLLNVVTDPITPADATVTDGPRIETLGSGEDTDPAMEYALSVVAAAARNVDIERGSVDLGERGGSVTNQTGAIVGLDTPGAESHVRTRGDFTLEGTNIGSDGPPIEIEGDSTAVLRLIADGDIKATIETAAFGAYSVVQSDVEGTTEVGGLDIIQIAPEDDGDPDTVATVSQINNVETGGSFEYELASETDTDGIRISRMVVGSNAEGAARILSPGGDITIDAPAVDDDATIKLMGGHLALETPRTSQGSVLASTPDDNDVHIDLGGDLGGGELLVLAGGSVGTAADELKTRGVAKVAGGNGDGFFLNSTGLDRLEIAEIENFDVTDMGEDRSGTLIRGIRGVGTSGDTVIRNTNGVNSTIVLGRITRAPRGLEAGQSIHLTSAGALELDATAIEISNAQLEFASTDPDETEFEATNESRLVANGDIVLGGTVETDADALATDEREDPDVSLDQFVEGSLTIETRNGTVRFDGDVGGDFAGDGMGALALLDTGSAQLPEARTFNANEVVFRGKLDGPGSATVKYKGGPSTRIALGGNVGSAVALDGLDLEASGIDFAVTNSDGSTSSANFVFANDGGIHLDATSSLTGGPDEIATSATITDTQGGLRLISSGDIMLGNQTELTSRDKLSVTGDLILDSKGTVRVGDISANKILITAPTIEITKREAGDLELIDGSIVEDADAGTDFVANEIRLSSAPVLTGGTGEAPTFFLGSGGVSIPGGLNGIQIRRFNESLSAVTPGAFIGVDGQVLDLTGSGPVLVADPTRELPRVEPLNLPSGPPEMGDDAPAAAPSLGAPAVLAFLRCGGEPGNKLDCETEDAEKINSVTAFDRSGLATARALEVTQRYQNLVAAPGAEERLRADFASAGSSYATASETQPGDPVDGAAFYHFLEASGEPALESVRELSWLFTQIQLLGMSEADTRRLQEGLADEFASATGLSGLNGEGVVAAVDASPIGLPR